MADLKEMVRDNKMSDFVMCSDGDLWYRTREEKFDFPIPLTEVKGGIYTASMKSITLMRYIRKHLSFLENVKVVKEVSV